MCEILKRPTDFFEGAIVQNSQIVCEIFGTYMGKYKYN